MELMTIRACGAGRKRNVVSITTKRSVRLQPPPALFNSFAVDVWKKHAKILAECGVLDHEHYQMLILYCNAWHYIVEADASIVENTKATKSSRGHTSEGGSGGAKTILSLLQGI